MFCNSSSSLFITSPPLHVSLSSPSSSSVLSSPQLVLRWFAVFLLRKTFWCEAGLLITLTSSRVQGVFTRCSRLSCLIIQSDLVEGRRSRCDHRLPANSGSLWEPGDAEQQLLVKTLFIQRDLTELCPASCTCTCLNWEQTSTTSHSSLRSAWCLRGGHLRVWCFLQTRSTRSLH